MNTFFLGVPEWREIADSGTFPDLNHLLEGVERSESVLGGLDTSPELVGGLYWVLGWKYAVKSLLDISRREREDK